LVLNEESTEKLSKNSDSKDTNGRVAKEIEYIINATNKSKNNY